MSHKYFRAQAVRLRPEGLERRLLLTVNAALFEADAFLTTSNGQGVATGDLDGDGDLDAFIAKHAENNTVLINDGSGNFAEQQVGGPSDDRFSFEVALGDLDGDGDLDAYVANEQQDKVWLNDGNGNFTDSLQGLYSDRTIHVVLGDLDSDGDLDAALATIEGPLFAENLGDGTLSLKTIDVAPVSSRGLDVGDLNGDGHLDLFVAHADEHFVYHNDGAGGFTLDVDSFQYLPFGSKNVSLGDLDGDGDLDAFDADDTGPNHVWINRGSGMFSLSSQPQIDAVDDVSYQIDLGDVDVDGDLDAFVANNGPNVVWANDGHGNFTQYGTALGVGDTRGTVLGDWDGDGDLDALGVNTSSEHTVWRNDILTIQGTSGDDEIEVFLGPSVTVTVNGTQSIYDVNNVPFMSVDGLGGYDRITVLGSSLDEVASADGDTGTFSFSSEIYQLVGSDFEDVTLDGDTGADYIDLYGSSDAGKKDKLHGSIDSTTLHAGYTGTDPNTADYIFQALNFDRVDSFGRGGVDYGQVYGTDGDDHFYRFADYEVMVAGDSTQKTKGFARIDAFGRHGTDVAYFDDTSGDDHFYTFPEFVVMVLGNEQDRVMAKGFLDISAVSSQGGNDTAHLRDKVTLDRLFADEEFALLLRTVEEQRESVLGFANVVGTTVSGGTFTLPEDLELPLPLPVDAPLFDGTGQPFTEGPSQGVMAGDLNGDGILDAFIADSGTNTVLLGDGYGYFAEQVANPDWYGSFTTEAALGDLDGDGDLDAWVAGILNSIWLNDGSGNFTTGQVLDWGTLIHVVLADFDTDGDLDAATASSGAAIVWENQGDGTFEIGPGFTGGAGQCRGIDVGDLDGNGELDIFLACEYGHVVGLADGNGGYNTTTLPFGAKNVALGDLDGDGDLDAFDANLQGPSRVWVNDGLGAFTESSQPHLAARDPGGTWEVVLGDIDRDGDLDAVGTFVWRNDGFGNFSEGDLLGFNHGVELGDWDFDRDLDAIIVEHGLGPNVLENELTTIWGTSGDDVIEIEIFANHLEVQINGQFDSFGIKPYMSIDGLAGDDHIIVRSSSSQYVHASADADTGRFSLTSDAFQLAGTGFGEVTFDSFGTVELYGSSDPGKKDKLGGAFGETFPGTVDETTLHAGYVGTDPNTADYIFRALNIQHVESYGRGGAGDYAQLFGSDYDDHFYRFADHEVLMAVDSTQRTQGFARVDAFGRHGTDVAYFEDTTGNDHFYTFPEFVVMVLGNEQDRVMAKGFLDVSGISSNGGDDTAHLRNASTVDALFANSAGALLLREQQRESVLGFANVNATALSGETPLAVVVDDAVNTVLTGTWLTDRD